MKGVFPLFIILAASSLSAEVKNYYFQNASTYNRGWIETAGWLVEDGDTKVEASQYPNNSDDITANVVFCGDYLKNTSCPDVIVRNDITVNNTTFEVGATNTSSMGISIHSGRTLTIEGDLLLTLADGATSTSTTQRIVSSKQADMGTLVVKGNVYAGADSTQSVGTLRLGGVKNVIDNSWESALKNISIAGDMSAAKSSTIQINASKINTDNSTMNELIEASLANPDVVIGGSLSANGSGDSNPNLCLFNLNGGTNSLGGVTTFKIAEGITGAWNSMKNDASKAGTKSLSILLLNNTGGYSTNAWMYDDNVSNVVASTGIAMSGPGMNTNSQVKIIMDGTGSQIFNGERFWISGGVEVRNGTLQIRMHSNSKYESGKDTDGNEISGEEIRLMNHGDLTLKGGKFGSLLEGNGSMGFNNLYYSGGTYMLGVDYDGGNDMLKFYGGVYKGEGWIDGVSKFYIEVSGTKDNLVDNWAHIFEWDNTANETDFEASDFYSEDFNEYSAIFKIEDDGLWMMYTEVPEPAAFAAIFGALALALAATKRRK